MVSSDRGLTPTVRCEKRGAQIVPRKDFAAQCQSSPAKQWTTCRVDNFSSSGVGQVQLPADIATGVEYQLDSVVEVGHDH